MNTVVFLDLDGTLWEYGVVPESARRAIRQAQARGHKFLTNTGRARSEVPDLAYLELDGYCFAAGAEIILDNKTVLDAPLSPGQVHGVARAFDSFGLNYNYEGGSKSWVQVNDPAALEALRNLVKDAPDPILSMPDASGMAREDFSRIHKLFYHGRAVDYNEVRERMPEGVVLTDLGNNMAEATHADVSKATAMEVVRTALGPQWRTMAVGDSDNDLPMLRAADVSVAMGNGNKNAKAAATWVTTDLHEDGLANALAHFGLLG